MKNNVLENLKSITDDDLLDLLFVMRDTLPRPVVDEFVRRGQRMIEPLWDIIADDNLWQSDDNEWWAVIHATFILGAIGGKDAVVPLIMSLRFADAFDCDWISEALPSIFRSIGPAALEPLKKVVLDRSNNWYTRVGALEGMAAVSVNNPEFGQEVFDFVARILNDLSESMMVRGLAGSILLDFKQKKCEKSLLEFARQDQEMKKADLDYDHHFDEDWVLKELKSDEKQIQHYSDNWLKFYEDEEIAARQKRWRDEARRDAWWGFIYRWREARKIKKEIAELEKKINEQK